MPRWTAACVFSAATACAPAHQPCPSVVSAQSPPAAARSPGFADAPPSTEARAPAGEVPGLCAKGGAAHTAATTTLAALDKKVAAVGDAGDPKPLVAEVSALLATPCFALAREDNGGDLPWSSALSLR